MYMIFAWPFYIVNIVKAKWYDSRIFRKENLKEEKSRIRENQ